MNREFNAIIAGGKLPESTAMAIGQVIREFDGKRVVVTIREAKKRRSTSANSYYWGVVIPAVVRFFREAGNMVDGDDVHDFLKLRVGKLAQNIVTPTGEVVKSLGSTAKLSTDEFQSYMHQIRAWGAEYGLVIPEPNEG